MSLDRLRSFHAELAEAKSVLSLVKSKSQKCGPLKPPTSLGSKQNMEDKSCRSSLDVECGSTISDTEIGQPMSSDSTASMPSINKLNRAAVFAEYANLCATRRDPATRGLVTDRELEEALEACKRIDTRDEQTRALAKFSSAIQSASKEHVVHPKPNLEHVEQMPMPNFTRYRAENSGICPPAASPAAQPSPIASLQPKASSNQSVDNQSRRSYLAHYPPPTSGPKTRNDIFNAQPTPQILPQTTAVHSATPKSETYPRDFVNDAMKALSTDAKPLETLRKKYSEETMKRMGFSEEAKSNSEQASCRTSPTQLFQDVTEQRKNGDWRADIDTQKGLDNEDWDVIHSGNPGGNEVDVKKEDAVDDEWEVVNKDDKMD